MNTITPITPLGLNQTQAAQQIKQTTSENSFSSVLSDALQQVNQTQKESEVMTDKLITGEVTDIPQVMIAAQKASISLELTVQVRNKVIEAYQEIMRMQV